jgi:hypothetical protein
MTAVGSVPDVITWKVMPVCAPYAFLLLCLALPPTHPFFPALRNSQSAIRNSQLFLHALRLAPFALCLSFTLLGPTTRYI